jgi:AraC-like DNA-binding protein
VIGPLSLSLAIGSANGFALSLLLGSTVRRQPANFALAALIALLALRLGPYILGFAGVYDTHRWLTFLPFDMSFAYGPLFWIYLRTLTDGRAPPKWHLHLAPAAVQLAYWLACFVLPLDAKWDWYTGSHLQVIAPICAALALASAGSYLIASWRVVRRYRRWLDGSFANRDEVRLETLQMALTAFGVTILVAAGFTITAWFIAPLDYFARFPLMVVFAGLSYVLGLHGWRNASLQYPRYTPLLDRDKDHPTAKQTSPIDYASQGQAWRARIIQAGWWRDETLDLAGLARELGTSPRTLSRVLSAGLNQSFREFIGRIRVDAVAQALADPANTEPILQIALASGFNSKASFNRAFEAFRGMTPSAWRRSAANQRLKIRQSAAEAATEATSRGI